MDREYIIDKKNNVFIKKYPQYDNINEKVALEYKKGLILSKIINYPKPIKFCGSEIHYELLGIKQSLHEAKKNNELKYSDLFFIGEQLRKMHDKGIIHGDFTTLNVIFTHNNKIYFIDASFSFYNVDGNGDVVIYSKDIYKDLALFLMHLKIDNSLLQWWKFFQINKIKKMTDSFLSGYFNDVKKDFDYKRVLIYENKAIVSNIRFYRQSNATLLYRCIIILLLNSLFLYNRFKIWQK